MVSTTLTWSAQDILGQGSGSTSMLASLTTLMVYSLVEENKEHDCIDALQGCPMLAQEVALPLREVMLV